MDTLSQQSPSRRRSFLHGLSRGLPILLGYIPVSFAFAVMAVGSGLPPELVVLISLSNFTSAGQAAGTGLLAAGAALPEIGITVFIINIRYMLMSLSLSQKVPGMSTAKRLLMANGVTDEIFFLASSELSPLSGWFFAGLACGPYAGWGLGTLLGALLGMILPTALVSALGIALYAMFIAIVMPALRRSYKVTIITLTAVALSCLFYFVPPFTAVPSGWALIISAVVSAALGAWLLPEKEAAT